MVTLREEHVGTYNRRFEVQLDGGDQVEAVLYHGKTLCVSSQVGCAVSCPFCASGAQGLARNLAYEEMVGQVEAVRQMGHDLTRVTVSGVGEPLHNFEAVGRFVQYCRDQELGVSLTTSGGPTRKLATWLRELPHRGMTISVHSGTEAVRAQMVPRGPSLEQLFGTLGDVLPTLSRGRRRRVGLAYLMISGRNDSDAEIDAFLERAVPIGLDVHLFAYNPVASSAERPVTRERYEAVYARMVKTGLFVRMSSKARTEANGGCGTLVALSKKLPGPTRPVPTALPTDGRATVESTG